MHNLITWLLAYIVIQYKIIIYLMGLLLGKSMTRHVYDDSINKPYRKLQVDQMPVIEVPE